MKIFSGSSNKPLAQKVAKNLNLEVSSLELHRFDDGEMRIRVVDGDLEEDVVLVHSTGIPVHQNYMELFLTLDALKRSGARSITLVAPYLGYQRQDHVFRSGEEVGFEMVAKILESLRVDKLISFDFHSIKIPEFFKIPVVHLSALPLFAEKIGELSSYQFSGVGYQNQVHRLSVSQSDRPKTVKPESENRKPRTDNRDFVLLSPDMGGIRRIKILSELTGSPFATIEKNRDLVTGSVQSEKIEGEVRGKNIAIVDDMISTGQTLQAAVDLLRSKGAEKIDIFATHAVFSSKSYEILGSLPVERVVVTDTIDVPRDKRFPKLEILSVAELICGSLKQ